MTDDELCLLSALELRALLIGREVSAREVVTAHLGRLDRLNPMINAVVTVTADRALAAAGRADEQLLRSGPIGALHGIPVAHKDIHDTAGVRTTHGSRLFADHVPTTDALVVARMAAAGAISLGKTNVPEFATGSQTYNAVFGPTRNPYDRTKTAGGSSGGAAAALASGLVALADGSDMGGSLRNPASFTNVVGLRPSPGRVPAVVTTDAWFTLSVIGPMARTVADAALLLSVQAGYDRASPLALPGDGSEFAAPLVPRLAGVRVGWTDDLGGLPIEPRVTAVLREAGLAALVAGGAQVDPVALELAGAEESFRTLRAAQYAAELGALVDEHRGEVNPDVVENVEAGRRLRGADLERAHRLRTALWRRMVALFDRFDVIAAPVSAVPPFDVELPWVREIAGVAQTDYLDWMRSSYWISATGLPAISVPCGFTDDGLPIGLQLIGAPQSERALLEVAAGFEQAVPAGLRRPI